MAGGSHTHVKAFLDQFHGEVFTRADIVSIQRFNGCVTIKAADGATQTVDRVVIVTHADEAYRLLADPSEDERRLLGAWRYSTNQTYLHTDLTWKPSNPNTWASWNIIRGTRSDSSAPVTLTYHMNRLQELKTRNLDQVTLNPFKPIAEAKVISQLTYTHPVVTFDSLTNQTDLHGLNGVRNTYFCGSHFGYGFHEDAARSGVQVAAALGVNHEF